MLITLWPFIANLIFHRIFSICNIICLFFDKLFRFSFFILSLSSIFLVHSINSQIVIIILLNINTLKRIDNTNKEKGKNPKRTKNKNKENVIIKLITDHLNKL